MPRLFYKDLRAHEAAYRNNRADEAVNDLILGAKVNTLRNMEQARERGIDQVAKNYGMFLKALKTKNIELVNRANKAEEKAAEGAVRASEAEEVANDVIKQVSGKKVGPTNVLMPDKQQRSMSIASDTNTDPEEVEMKESYKDVKRSLINRAERSIDGVKKATVAIRKIKDTFLTDQNTQRGAEFEKEFNEELKKIRKAYGTKGNTIDNAKKALRNMRS